MKKTLVLAILGVAAGVATSYGQGTVGFFNYFSSTSPTIKYAASGVPAGKAGLALGGDFAAELGWFNGNASSAAQITWLPGTITGFGAVTSAYPNSVADGDLASGAGWYFGPTYTIAGSTAGTSVTLDIAYFNGNGPSFGAGDTSTVEGFSGLFHATLGGTTSGGSLAPASMAGAPLATVASVAAVPEPSVLALSGIGAAALMLVRRKK